MVANLNVFISYARNDGRNYAEQLYKFLTDHGIRAWRDERNIDPYQDFSGEIEKAIENSTHVVVCVTQSIASRKDSFVRREIIYAQGWERSIIPLLMPDFDQRYLPILINHLTWIKISDPNSDFSKLIDRLADAKTYDTSYVYVKDVYFDYLQSLYREIVDFLHTAIPTLIPRKLKVIKEMNKDIKNELPSALGQGFKTLSFRNSKQSSKSTEYVDSIHNIFETGNRKILLSGEAGAGKTIALMAFAREAVVMRLEDSSNPIPIVAPLSSWTPNTESSIFDWLGQLNDFLTPKDISDAVKSEKALLILDGLDEIDSRRINSKDLSSPRQQFIDALNEYVENNQVLITSRPKEYERLELKNTVNVILSLQPLQDSEIEKYLIKNRNLIITLNKNPLFKNLSRTALILSIISYVYSDADSVALKSISILESEGEIRDRVFRDYIGKKYEDKTISSDISLDQIYELLGQLAFEILGNYRNSDEVSFRKIAQVALTETKSFMSICSELHLLLPSRQEVFRYPHALIRDHFAYDYIVRFNLLENKETSEKAISALKIIKDNRAADILMTLFHKNTIQRRSAADAIVLLGEKGIEALVSLLQDNTLSADKHLDIASALSMHLWSKGRNSHIEKAIITRFKSIKDEHLDQHWYFILGVTKNPEAAQILIDLGNRNTFEERSKVISNLGGFDDPTVYKYVRSLLSDNNSIIRKSALSALRRNKAQHADAILLATKDRSSAVRIEATHILGELRDEKYIEQLIKLLKDKSAKVREYAALGLRYLHPKQALEPLLYASKDKNAKVRQSAIVALAYYEDTRAFEKIVKSLNDENLEVALRGIESLANSKHPRLVNILISMLNNDDPSIASHAAFQFVHIRDQSAVEPLIEAAFGNTNPTTLGMALQNQNSEDFAAQELIPYLSHPDAAVRERITDVLGSLKSSLAISPIIKVLFDLDEKVRKKALVALTLIGNPAVPALINLFKIDNDLIRHTAISILACLNDTASIEITIAALNDSNPIIRKTAHLLLTEIDLFH